MCHKPCIQQIFLKTIKLPLHTLASYPANYWWHLQMGIYTWNNNQDQFF